MLVVSSTKRVIPINDDDDDVKDSDFSESDEVSAAMTSLPRVVLDANPRCEQQQHATQRRRTFVVTRKEIEGNLGWSAVSVKASMASV